MHPGAEWVLQPVRDGEWWNVVDRGKCSAVGEGYRQETGLQAPNRLCYGGKVGGSFRGRPEGAETVRAATAGSLPPVMPQRKLVEVLGNEVRQGSPGELMVESTPSRQRRPPCKTNKEVSDQAADAAALTYLLTYLRGGWG